jgi:hypothetical protein
MEHADRSVRWLAFLGGILLCWALMFVICPTINHIFPAMNRMAGVVEEYNLRTGMFFYTDVAVSGDAGIETSSTIRFAPSGQ